MNPWWRPKSPLMLKASGLVVEFALEALLLVIQFAPPVLLRLMGRFLGLILPRLARKEAKVLRENLWRIFGLAPHSVFARRFIRQCYAFQAIAGLESARGYRRPERVVFEGMEEARAILDEATRGGRGIVMVTGHHGNWELCSIAVVKLLNTKMTLIAKPSKNPGVTRVLDRIRTRVGYDLLWSGSERLMDDLEARVRKGEAVGFVMDQKPSHGRGIEAPFFGVTVPFPAGGPVTAVRANVAVATLMAFRVGWMRYRLHCRVLSTPEDQGRTLESVTHACAAEFERMTRLYPEQWPWSYRRWKWA